MQANMTRALLAGALMSIPLLAGAGDAPKEKALAISAADAKLEWGPCPEFMPKGCQVAVLHGDPAKPNSDIFFKVPGGSEIPHHWHTSPERMMLVSGQLTVNYDGQPPAVLKAGMYAYGPARLGHSASCAKGDACVLFIAFEAPLDAHLTESKGK